MTDTLISPELLAYKPEFISNPRKELLGIRFDVQALLEARVGENWQEAMRNFIEAGPSVTRTGDHSSVRESTRSFTLTMVKGHELEQAFPGMWELYQGAFKHMMQTALPAGVEPLKLREDLDGAFEPFSQRPHDPSSGERRRMEAHVDGCYTSVLAIDAPKDGEQQGGRLVIANNADAQSIDEINADAVFITHKPGTLLCFSRGRIYPHYTEEVTDLNAHRTMVGMNYPVESETPEEARELTGHAYNEL